MRIKVTVIISILILLMMLATSCSIAKKESFSLLNDINSIEIYIEGTKNVEYAKDKDFERIEEFIIAYNEAKPTDNSLGTTHNNEVVINYVNGEKTHVLGGTQGFQTVVMGDKQLNIKGDKLWDYFKKLSF